FPSRKSTHAVRDEAGGFLELGGNMSNLLDNVGDSALYKANLWMRRRSIMPKPVQRMTVPSCLCKVGKKVHPGPTPVASAMHENDRPQALNRCKWHYTLNAHAMNPVLQLIHARPRFSMSKYHNNT